MKFDFPWPQSSLKDENNKHDDNHHSQSNKDIIFDQQTKTCKLQALKEKKMADTSLVFANQGNTFVFDDGNPNSDLMLIGEAPGEQEDLQGIPFVGKSGQLLRFFLKEALLNDFYMTNIISWRPPNNRTPTDEEIALMQPYIFEHISIIQPKIIVTVGTTSLKALQINSTITKAQGHLFETKIGKIYPIYHPSYALRVTSKKKELWHSLLTLHKILTTDTYDDTNDSLSATDICA